MIPLPFPVPWKLVGMVAGPVIGGALIWLAVHEGNDWSKRQYRAGWDANEARWQAYEAESARATLSKAATLTARSNEANLAYVKVIAERKPQIVRVTETIHEKEATLTGPCRSAGSVLDLEALRAAAGLSPDAAPSDPD